MSTTFVKIFKAMLKYFPKLPFLFSTNPTYLPFCAKKRTEERLHPFQKNIFLKEGHTHHIPVGLGSRIIACCRKYAAFSRPSTLVIRLSSCSMERISS